MRTKIVAMNMNLPLPHGGGDPLGDFPLVDESTLPDSGTTEADAHNEPEPLVEMNLPTPKGKTAPTAPDTTQEPAPTGEPQTVPLAALHEERNAHKALKEHAQRLEQFAREAALRLQQQQAAPQQQQQPQTEQIPEFVDDPQGHIAAQFAALRKEMAGLNQFANGMTQQQQQQIQQQQLLAHGRAQESVYTQTVPDYPKAVDHLIKQKTAEYMAYGMDQATAEQALARDYAGIVQMAQQNNTNPAATIYNLAKVLGYNPAAAPADQQQQQQQQQPTKKPNTSLSNLSGAHDPDQKGTLTLDSLAAMSDADFNKMFDEMSKGSTQKPRY